MAAVSRLLLKRRDSWVANQRLMVLMDNGRTPGLQISWPGFRGSCTMHFMESRQKEDEEVSSQATTLQFGSPGKSRWEEYVCPGYPHCENFDCDLCDNPSETEVEDAKADERNTAPPGSALYLQNAVRAYHLRRERKEANNAKLGKGKGRSGGRAAPNKGKGKGTSKGKSKEAHEIKSCDTGTLRYKADRPLHERWGAPVVSGPPRVGPVEWDNLIRSGGYSDTSTDSDY